jgi:hypothetical protein
LDDRQNFFRHDGFAFGQEPSQDVIHEFQSFVFGGMQDLQVLLDRGRFTGPREQLVVGHAEPGCRIQMVDVFVVGERARLADQRIDDVAKVDPLLALPEQSRQAFQALAAVPEFEMVLVDQHVHFQADVFAADRVGVSLDTQDAIRFDPDTHRRESVEPLVRQRLQGFAFFLENVGAFVVTPRNELPEKSQILLPVGEITIATQPQRLIKPRFQMSMSRLYVAVLMRLADIDAMTSDAIMIEQRLVLCRELLVAGKVVDRRGKAVAADPPGHAAGRVQGVLQTRRQRLERLRVAKVDVFPVGIREDGVEQHVIVRTSLNRNLQSIQIDEVKSDHVARMMNLGEVDFLLHPVLQLPSLNSPLQRPSNRIGDPQLALATGRWIVFLFQPIEQGKGSQPGVPFQEFLDLRPIRIEGVFPSPIVAWLPLLLAGKYAAIAILPNRSFAHLEPPCNLCHGMSAVKHREHPAGLLVLEHRKPPLC